MAESRKYATATMVPMQLLKADGSYVTGGDWAPADGDVTYSLSTDGLAFSAGPTNVAALPTYVHGVWQFPMDVAETTAKISMVRIVAAGVQSDAFFVETYGHADAMYPDDASVASPDIVAEIGALLAAGLTLTAGERTAIANEVEAQIIDETDSEKVLTAITDKIASVNPSLSGLTIAAIASGVRDVLNTAPAANSLGAHVKAVADRTPGAGTLSTAADITAAQTAITNAIAALNNLSPAGAQAAVAAALLAYAAAKTSDVTALNNISAAGVQAAVAAALAAYSAATTGNVGAVPAAVLTAAQAAPIHARIKIVNGTPIQGTGVAGDPMRPA